MPTPSWLAPLLATDTPALPQAWAMQLALTAGWSLALALLGAVLALRLPLPARRGLAAALALWTWLPGPFSPDYWLGLAFHAPSLSAMLLCLVFLRRLLGPSAPVAGLPLAAAARSPGSFVLDWGLPCAGIALGYLLLLDTFAVLPLEVYAWGFSPALLLGLLALSLAPWVLRGRAPAAGAAGVWMAPAALLLFAATRLPTGNVWDALLDPCLWLLLQLALLRRLFRRRRV
jgi:hypothetical protein